MATAYCKVEKHKGKIKKDFERVINRARNVSKEEISFHKN